MDHRWRETLVFELAGRRFGLPAADVQELVRMVTITPMPIGSGHVEGVINLRGSVVTVVDLRARLGLPAKEADLNESLVIVRRGRRLAAIRVDRPIELATLDDDDVDPPPPYAADSDVATSAVAKLAGGLAVLLDPESLLGPESVATSAWLDAGASAAAAAVVVVPPP